MEDQAIGRVAQVLSDWNPLGAAARDFPDLDGYRVEAIDIIFHLRATLKPRSPEAVVMEVLNGAFNISLAVGECAGPAERIVAIVNEGNGTRYSDSSSNS